MSEQLSQTAVLCINIGTPEAPETQPVRRYLKQFLSDPRVVDISWLGRQLLLNLFILPFRPKKSAEAYQAIWTSEGSPLLIETEKFCSGLQEKLGDSFYVLPAMRYGEPSLEKALDRVKDFPRVILFPMFPQYASSSTGSCLELCFNYFAKQNNVPAVKVVEPYYQKPGFIKSLLASCEESVDLTEWDHLLLSYHGLPQRQIQKSEVAGAKICDQEKPCPMGTENRFCYRAQCYQTSRLLTKELGLNSSQYTVAFQSRLGRTPWIKPYTDEVLETFVKSGIKRLVVMCPSFVADCLETLEEIGIRAKEDWLKLGGTDLKLVPCLNHSKLWIEVSASLVQEIA